MSGFVFVGTVLFFTFLLALSAFSRMAQNVHTLLRDFEKEAQDHRVELRRMREALERMSPPAA
jgi:hypothetical protein